MRALLWGIVVLVLMAGCSGHPDLEGELKGEIRPPLLSAERLTDGAWKQLTMASNKIGFFRFAPHETRPDQLSVTAATGTGESLSGLFQFTDAGEAAHRDAFLIG